ncbi:MAG: hypothetical protein Q8784_01370 [Vigna little leaf phytoplasma]|nr:hypothetical protein [Vigna little leaf phytoplasma]
MFNINKNSKMHFYLFLIMIFFISNIFFIFLSFFVSFMFFKKQTRNIGENYKIIPFKYVSMPLIQAQNLEASNTQLVTSQADKLSDMKMTLQNKNNQLNQLNDEEFQQKEKLQELEAQIKSKEEKKRRINREYTG